MGYKGYCNGFGKVNLFILVLLSYVNLDLNVSDLCDL